MGNVLAASSSSGGFSSSTLIFIVLIVVVVYMLMIRPQQRRKQQAQQKQNSVQPGARVRTTAGMYATVVDVDGDDVVLEVAPGVEVRYMKRAIMDVVSPGEEPEAESTVDDETDDVDDVDDTHDTDEAPEADDEETAYEQATGTKKD
jgi:preprotein translocase subunit YajC